MHQYKDLLQEFLIERLKTCRKERCFTQEIMAEKLQISPRSYAYLEGGTYACSATTLMFFFLILTDEEVIRLRLEFCALVQRRVEYVVA